MARTRGGLSGDKGRGGGRGTGRSTVGEEPVQGQSQNLLSPELIAMITQVVTTVLAQRAAEEAPSIVESSSRSGVLNIDTNKRKDFGESSSAKESGKTDPKRHNKGKAHRVEKVSGKGYRGELPKCLSCMMHHPTGDRCIECRNCKNLGHIAKFCKESDDKSHVLPLISKKAVETEPASSLAIVLWKGSATSEFANSVEPLGSSGSNKEVGEASRLGDAKRRKKGKRLVKEGCLGMEPWCELCNRHHQRGIPCHICGHCGKLGHEVNECLEARRLRM